MKMKLKVIPNKNILMNSVTFSNEEIRTSFFFINRDFNIDKLVCDNIEITPKIVLEGLKGFNYMLNKVIIPEDTKSISIEYTGYLSGETGCCPYVRERITADFSMLRWETFYYPFFCKNDGEDIYSYLSLKGECEVKLTVPLDYEVVTSEPLISKEVNRQEILYTYVNHAGFRNNFCCTVAKYRLIYTDVGIFYLLNSCNQEELEQVMLKAYNYMNEHFGNKNIDSNTIYAAIPDGLGSFVMKEAAVVYIQESTFNTIKNLSQIIHEVIHLGWNAKPDKNDQRIRFFDEAFTCYFELRVMDYLIGEKYMLDKLINVYKRQISSGKYKCVPISEFGKFEYGDLSYTIGAIFLYELCKFLGESCFDQITTLFLLKYRNNEVTLKKFCDEYIENADEELKDKLKLFLERWLYSVDEYKKYLV